MNEGHVTDVNLLNSWFSHALVLISFLWIKLIPLGQGKWNFSILIEWRSSVSTELLYAQKEALMKNSSLGPEHFSEVFVYGTRHLTYMNTVNV